MNFLFKVMIFHVCLPACICDILYDLIVLGANSDFQKVDPKRFSQLEIHPESSCFLIPFWFQPTFKRSKFAKICSSVSRGAFQLLACADLFEALLILRLRQIQLGDQPAQPRSRRRRRLSFKKTSWCSTGGKMMEKMDLS